VRRASVRKSSRSTDVSTNISDPSIRPNGLRSPAPPGRASPRIARVNGAEPAGAGTHGSHQHNGRVPAFSIHRYWDTSPLRTRCSGVFANNALDRGEGGGRSPWAPAQPRRFSQCGRPTPTVLIPSLWRCNLAGSCIFRRFGEAGLAAAGGSETLRDGDALEFRHGELYPKSRAKSPCEAPGRSKPQKRSGVPTSSHEPVYSSGAQRFAWP